MFMGLQRVGHDRRTTLHLNEKHLCLDAQLLLLLLLLSRFSCVQLCATP